MESFTGPYDIVRIFRSRKRRSLADELNELYAYCEKSVKQYLEIKETTKLEEVKSIISGIADSWAKIG